VRDDPLQRHDLRPEIARGFRRASGVGDGDAVLEVGPGTGALTREVLAAGARVHAIERDPGRCRDLVSGFADATAAGRLVLHAGDARTLAPSLPPGWRVVANPPFAIAAALLRRWWCEDLPGGPPSAIDLVLQRELAARLLPRRDGYAAIAVLCELSGGAAIRSGFPRDATRPRSKVDLVHWSWRREAWGRDPGELRSVARLLDAAFAGPHTVREALRGIATGKILARQAGTHRWDPDDHPRRVPPKAWLALATYLRSIGRC